jgi:hypothetical protein
VPVSQTACLSAAYISEIIEGIKRRIMERTGTQYIKISYTVKVKRILQMRPQWKLDENGKIIFRRVRGCRVD